MKPARPLLLALALLSLAACVEDRSPEGVPPDELPGPPTGQGALLGGWFCNDSPEPEILFEADGDTRVFRTFRGGRPTGTGTWTWGDTLTVDVAGTLRSFAHVAREGDQLTLEGAEETWICTLVEEPEG